MDKKIEVRSQKSEVRIKAFFFYLLLTAYCLLPTAFADTSDVYLSITKAGGAKIRIAIPDFSFQEGAIDRENFSRKSAEILVVRPRNPGVFRGHRNRPRGQDHYSNHKKTGKIN